MSARVEKLIVAHTRARAALIAADDRRSTKPLRRSAITICELFPSGPGTGYRISTHHEIDTQLEAYIAKCRKKGRWDAYQVHTTEAGVDGRPSTVRPVLPPPEFCRNTLRAFRDRIKDYHARLDAKIAEVKAQNAASGATRAFDRWLAARDREMHTMDRLIAVFEGNNRAETTRVARYIAKIESNELDRICRLPEHRRTSFDMFIGWSHDVLLAIANAQVRRRRRARELKKTVGRR